MTGFNRNSNGKHHSATLEAEPQHFTVNLGDEPEHSDPHVEPEPQPLGIPGPPTWSSDSLRAQVEQSNSGLRERLLSRLERMDPQQLAGCVGSVLSKLGYSADGAPKTIDGELEFTGTLTVGGAIASRLAVHVRRHGGSQLGVDAVRALRGCLDLEEQGLLVTTGDFSEAAAGEARASGRRQISLMNGGQIAELMLEHEIGVTATTFKVYDVVLD